MYTSVKEEDNIYREQIQVQTHKLTISYTHLDIWQTKKILSICILCVHVPLAAAVLVCVHVPLSGTDGTVNESSKPH